MIDKLVSILSNPTFVSISQNTKSSVSIETGLKAVGRPAFTLADKNTDKQTRKYSAVKEFLYQTLCLGIYIAFIIPIFKNKAFSAGKHIFKDEAAQFGKFKDFKEYFKYFNQASVKKELRDLNKCKDLPDGLKKELEKENPETYPLIKGIIELSSIIGSVFGLTIVAPEASHFILHPVMKALGMEKNKNEESNVKAESKKINKKA